MEIWQTVLVAIGGNTALIAVLTFLSKSLIEKILARDTKTFEVQLKATADAEIERLKQQITRELESYKVQLKKSEVFFQRELDAAFEFSAFFHSILPELRDPYEDWGEACDDIARDFQKIETRLNAFKTKHAAVLTDEENKVLDDATSDAAFGKFEVKGLDVSSAGNERADALYNKLKKLDQQLIARVRAQASL